MPYRTIPEPPAQKDMIEALRTILAHAEAGTITGIAVACVMKRNRYITDVRGYCLTHPTFTRGVIMSLGDELGALMHHTDPDETR